MRTVLREQRYRGLLKYRFLGPIFREGLTYHLHFNRASIQVVLCPAPPGTCIHFQNVLT